MCIEHMSYEQMHMVQTSASDRFGRYMYCFHLRSRYGLNFGELIFCLREIRFRIRGKGPVANPPFPKLQILAKSGNLKMAVSSVSLDPSQVSYSYDVFNFLTYSGVKTVDGAELVLVLGVEVVVVDLERTQISERICR